MVFSSLVLVRFCYNPCRFCSGQIVSPEGGPFKEEQNTSAIFQNGSRTLRGFFFSIPVRTCLNS